MTAAGTSARAFTTSIVGACPLGAAFGTAASRLKRAMAEVSPAADEAAMDEWGDVEAVRRLNEDDIRSIHAKNRRWWGTTIALLVGLLGVFFVAGWVFLLWLWSIIEGSPTIS